MKKITLIIGGILLLTNILTGLVITSYQSFNVFVTSIVIITTTFLVYLLKCLALKDAFYISLTTIFSIIGLTAFSLGIFTPQRFVNNWYLIVIFLLMAFEGITLLIVNQISKK